MSARDVCRSKTAFSTFARAERTGNVVGLRPYRCEVCRDFHLTSKVTKTQLARARAWRALNELRRKDIKGPLRDAAEAQWKALGGGEHAAD